MNSKSLFESISSMWHKKPKYKGLQVSTIGFLVALLGVILAYFSMLAKNSIGIDWLSMPFQVVVYLGWILLVGGVVAVFAGILIHFFVTFRDRA